jgi:hypothetical protein
VPDQVELNRSGAEHNVELAGQLGVSIGGDKKGQGTDISFKFSLQKDVQNVLSFAVSSRRRYSTGTNAMICHHRFELLSAQKKRESRERRRTLEKGK